uniref:Zeta_toxin domain-containing protein n=1 Tax=Ascaris lumbricoides TaxID=6252 RepID=A0A0M3HK30_ASCLU
MRPPSVMKAAEVARIPNVPIILFMGGPGGGKTRHAERVRDALADTGLVHICMPDLIRNAIAKYKDRYPEWKEAALRYHRGKFLSLNQVIIREIIDLI